LGDFLTQVLEHSQLQLDSKGDRN